MATLVLVSTVTVSAQFNLGKLFTDSNEPPNPKHGRITFWDPTIQQQRGIRALYYMVPLERENRNVDQRMHDQMAAYLGYFCQDVFTLQSFEDPTRKKMVENVLVMLVDEWKQQGKINPTVLFEGLPFLNVDALIFMERTHYDHAWKGDEKRLLIGMKVVAFELDYGQPLYNDRYLNDVLWFGERANYVKAEKAALVEIADHIGDAFQTAATTINNARDAELQAQLEEELRQRELLKQRIEEEKMLYDALVKEAELFLSTHDEPDEILIPLLAEKDALKAQLVGYQAVRETNRSDNKKDPLWKRVNSEGEVSPQNEANMQELAQSIQQHMQGYDVWVKEQQRTMEEEQVKQQAILQEQQQKKPVLIFTPTPANPPTPTPTPAILPVLEVPGRGLLDRRWLIPTPTPTPAVSSEGLPVRQGDLFGKGLPDGSGPVLSQPQPILQNRSGSIPDAPSIPSSLLDKFINPQSATGTIKSGSANIQSATATN
jgi:hypothetical protein